MKAQMKKHYGLDTIHVEKSLVGAGSDTYFVEVERKRYVVKFPSVSEINHPEAEPKLCEFLLSQGIPVCRFIKNSCGTWVTPADDGRMFHVQEFISGKLYDWNTAPEWLLKESAELLGKIHRALKNYRGLPVGIGASFFQHMTPENALHSYEKTLAIAREKGDNEIEDDLLYRIDLIKRFPKYYFDMDKLTCQATHGDYFISQLLCGEESIEAVIDWTTACVHPVVWEIMRSYVYAASECADGNIDTAGLSKYFENYCSFAKLNAYDLQQAARLFYYQIAVCDYYHQYYTSTADNREIYLRQAVFSTRLMKWFEKHVEEIADVLARKGECF